nr:hypothetical protein [Tanacetum cinerariifolium]
MLHVLRVEMVINSPWKLSKNWLVQKQMAFGQTATSKESSNPFMAGIQSLPLLGVNTPRSDEDRFKLMELMVFLMINGVCDEFELNAAHLSKFLLSGKYAAGGFEQIIDFLSGSYINHALTVNPHVYISYIKQFWNTAVVKRSGDITRVRKGFSRVETPLFETMLVVRDIAEEAEAQVLAQGNDVHEHAAEEVATDVVPPTPTSPSPSFPGRISVDMDQDEGIELVVDHEKDAEVLSMQEDDTEVQEAVEVVTTAKLMTEVVTAAATQVVAASTPISAAKPKILKIAAVSGVSTKRRKGVVIRDPEEELHTDTPAETPTKAAKRRKLSEEAQEADDLRRNLEIIQDEDDDTMFRELDEQDAIWRNQKSVHGLALVKRWKLLTSCGVHVIILSTVQLFLLVERRYPLSRFTLEQLVNMARLQVLSMQEDDTEVQEAIEVVTTAKLITEVVTAAATQVVATSTPIPAAKILKIAAAPAVSTRRRKGVVIRDPEEELHTDTPAKTPTVKDKGKRILIEDPKPMKKKD